MAKDITDKYIMWARLVIPAPQTLSIIDNKKCIDKPPIFVEFQF